MQAPDFELPNVAAGPDPYRLSAREGAVSFVVVFFQRDFHCVNCRRQVRAVADELPAFERLDAEPVSVLPEPVGRVREWQRQYDLPYPLLADESAAVGDEYDQPVRFGILGDVSDFFGRMPAVVVVDLTTPGAREVRYVHRGRSTFDRPAIEDVLAELDGPAGGGSGQERVDDDAGPEPGGDRS
jgi:peroxiredoxin Q/BCP